MDNLIKFFKMLSDETRLRIMILLFHEELVVCQICGILNLSQPKVSKHLTKLRDLGFVKDNRREKFVAYRLNLQESEMYNVINNIVNNIENHPQMKKDIERMKLKDEFLRNCLMNKK